MNWCDCRVNDVVWMQLQTLLGKSKTITSNRQFNSKTLKMELRWLFVWILKWKRFRLLLIVMIVINLLIPLLNLKMRVSVFQHQYKGLLLFERASMSENTKDNLGTD